MEAPEGCDVSVQIFKPHCALCVFSLGDIVESGKKIESLFQTGH